MIPSQKPGGTQKAKKKSGKLLNFLLISLIAQKSTPTYEQTYHDSVQDSRLGTKIFKATLWKYLANNINAIDIYTMWNST